MGRSARHPNATARSTNANNNAEEKGTSSSNIKELVAEAVNLWKTEHMNEIKALKMELAEVQKSQDFISQQYEKLKCEYNNLVKISNTQEAEIEYLKFHSTELEESGKKEQDKVDSLEYCRHMEKGPISIFFKIRFFSYFAFFLHFLSCLKKSAS